MTLVPLPKIDEIYAWLKDSHIYSTFHLSNGYYYLALLEGVKAKSTFVTPFGKFEFTWCPFGFAQVLAYFQQVLYEVLWSLEFKFAYLDDILLFSPDVQTCLQHLWIQFDRVTDADLKFKEIKCNLLKAHVQYLGHLITAQDI